MVPLLDGLTRRRRPGPCGTRLRPVSNTARRPSKGRPIRRPRRACNGQGKQAPARVVPELGAALAPPMHDDRMVRTPERSRDMAEHAASLEAEAERILGLLDAMEGRRPERDRDHPRLDPRPCEGFSPQPQRQSAAPPANSLEPAILPLETEEARQLLARRILRVTAIARQSIRSQQRNRRHELTVDDAPDRAPRSALRPPRGPGGRSAAASATTYDGSWPSATRARHRPRPDA
jgi:hypothetical protein